MSKVITLKLNRDGCKKTAKELKKYGSPHDAEFQKRVQEFMRKLSAIGFQEADRRFAAGAHDGNEKPIVRVEWDANGFRITAMGTDVCFIEFGVGDQTEESHPFASNASVPIYDGSYSEAHDGPYSHAGIWWYDGNPYTGIPATMPMYYSVKAMRENVRQIAKEAFG